MAFVVSISRRERNLQPSARRTAFFAAFFAAGALAVILM
jgi:hypothetical protein